MVARNRFLAESMLLNGTAGAGHQHLNHATSLHQMIPKVKKYSVPTCHSTLKQMEQARLAREFAEQQRAKNLSNIQNNNNEPEVDIQDHNGLPKLKRSLSRTSSVGKLVNNFENGTFTPSHCLANQQDNIVIRPLTKPPLAAKPVLRHTVSVSAF